VRAKWCMRMWWAAVVVAAVASSSCSEFVRQGQSPSQLTVMTVNTASSTGGVPTSFTGGPLLSDVQDDTGTVFNDFAQVQMRVTLRDLGGPGLAASPTSMNDVTVTRYRVSYRRSDGRNAEGLDVPRTFDGALTLTIPAGGSGNAIIELVRHVAKREAPLAGLSTSPVVLTMFAEITMFGRDQAGNDVAATGSVQINFANFAG
jgi:hypothetical protein